MRVTPTQLQEVLLIEPRVFEDERGWFLEDFQDTRFEEHGLPSHFRQENQSRSKHAVLRGLHYQMTRPQGKLVQSGASVLFAVCACAATDAIAKPANRRIATCRADRGAIRHSGIALR